METLKNFDQQLATNQWEEAQKTLHIFEHYGGFKKSSFKQWSPVYAVKALVKIDFQEMKSASKELKKIQMRLLNKLLRLGHEWKRCELREEFVEVLAHGDLELIKLLWDRNVLYLFLHSQNGFCLPWLAYNGRLDVLKWWIEDQQEFVQSEKQRKEKKFMNRRIGAQMQFARDMASTDEVREYLGTLLDNLYDDGYHNNEVWRKDIVMIVIVGLISGLIGMFLFAEFGWGYCQN